MQRHDAEPYKEDGLSDDECDGLSDTTSSAKTDEHASGESVDQDGHTKEAGFCVELNVEEAPIVQRS